MSELKQLEKKFTALLENQQKAIEELKEQNAQLVAEKVGKSRKATFTLSGTDDERITKGIRAIYSRKKYNPVVKEKGCFKISNIEVLSVQVTPAGHLRVQIKKTMYDGAVKEHPVMLWQKK